MIEALPLVQLGILLVRPGVYLEYRHPRRMTSRCRLLKTVTYLRNAMLGL